MTEDSPWRRILIALGFLRSKDTPPAMPAWALGLVTFASLLLGTTLATLLTPRGTSQMQIALLTLVVAIPANVFLTWLLRKSMANSGSGLASMETCGELG
jgi:hypothetical protein